MRIRNPRRSSRRTYLIVLVVLSVTALLLPGRWTGKLIGLVQVIVPFQHAATAAVDSVGDALHGSGTAVSQEAYEALERQKEASDHRIAALTVRVAELEREVEILTATRLWDAEGQRIGAVGRLIPAGIVTDDLLAWRSSRLVNAGSLQGVQHGSAVTSQHFTIDQGGNSDVRDGLGVVLGEVFVGLVEQVGTHTARVRLLSDVGVEMKVRIGRFTDDGFMPLDKYFWLAGRGNGVMEIRDAERRDVDAGLIRDGDIVMSGPAGLILPAAMTIGKITAVAPNRDNPLLSILTVKSAVDVASLRRVYVYESDDGVTDATIADGP